MDKEKVIKGLEYCSASCKGAWDEKNGCPYMSEWIHMTMHDKGINGRCVDILAKDALELLKTQEPVEPKKAIRYIDVDDEGHPYNPETYDCGSCGMELPQGANYCPECGRPVKWN